MKVLVINMSVKRWEKYKDDPRYERFEAVNGNEELDPEWVDKNYHYYWNANRKLRQSIAGCSESHLKCLRYIIKNKLDSVIIIEDDCILDFERLNELKDVKEACYIGGMFHPPILKDLRTFTRPEGMIEGINTINPQKFLITNCQAYYIPNHLQAHLLLTHQYSKRRAIDVEFKLLQKKGLLKHFLYPAIGTLYLPDAEQGFTWSQSSYKLKDNLQYY